MELLILVIGLVTLDLLALRFGQDSRDGFRTMRHGMEAAGARRFDPAYEVELARELQEARQRRLGRGRVVASRFGQSGGSFEQAA
jgi:hypothetical protein